MNQRSSGPNHYPTVCIIVVNYNNFEDTDECLSSVQDINYPNYCVLVVDNGSTDESGKKLAKKYEGFNFLHKSKNDGFAGGNNAGMKKALDNGVDYLLLLNNDTIVTPNILHSLIEAGENNPKSGIIAPKVVEYSGNRVLESGRELNCNKIHLKSPHGGKKLDELKGIEPANIVSGCCMLLKDCLIQDIGFLDSTRFFFGGEDIDFCLRARDSGWEIITQQNIFIRHKGSGTSTAGSPFQRYHFVRNKLYLYQKHPDNFPIWALIYRIIIDGMRAIKSIYTGDKEKTKAILYAYIDAILGKGGNMRFN